MKIHQLNSIIKATLCQSFRTRIINPGVCNSYKMVYSVHYGQLVTILKLVSEHCK